MPRRVTMREVAQAAGVSLATVSRALSQHPHLSSATRLRVEQVIKKLGYHPDPALRAIASCRWQNRRSKDGEVIAWLDFAAHPEPPPSAAQDAAMREGYRLEHYRASDLLPPRRLGDVLYHRGISGLVLVNSAETPELRDFPWERFCAVACWSSYATNPVDCVRFNPFDTVHAALEKLHAAGCRRPGIILLYGHRGLTVTNDKMLGSFDRYSRQLFDRPAAQPLLLEVDRFHPSKLGEWFEQERPDGIIGHHNGLYHQLTSVGLKFPQDASYLSLLGERLPTRGGAQSQVACFSNLKFRCAEVAVEQVALRLRYNQRGIPSHPMNFVLDPIWVPGKTCPARPPVRHPHAQA